MSVRSRTAPAQGLRRLKPPDMVTKDGVALARHGFKTCRIDDRNLATARFDEPRALHQAGCNSDTRPAGCDETRNHIVSKQQNIGSDSSASFQQPTAQPQ